MKTISLTQGFVALVDDDDHDFLSRFKWHIKSIDSLYAVRSKDNIPMHRDVVQAPRDVLVDHINGNTLDNRKSNLRFCNVKENNQNRRKQKTSRGKKTSSIYKGVSYNNPWMARITIDGKCKIIGRFNSEIDAAIAYDNVARKLFGQFAKLNFPEPKDSSYVPQNGTIDISDVMTYFK